MNINPCFICRCQKMKLLDLKDSPSLCIEPRVKKARPFFRTADTELECKTDVANTSLEQCLFLVAVLFWLQTSFSPGQVWILRGRLVWSTSHGGIAESLANFANFVVGSFHEHAGCPW